MRERRIELFVCECGHGHIELTKLITSRMGSSKKVERYSSIAPCPVCGSMVDINNRNLHNLVKRS